MKHLILVLLALLLTGCASETPDDPHSVTSPPASTAGTVSDPITQPSEVHHNRALSAYDTGIPDCQAICPMGEDMLLISGSEQTLLTVLSNEAVILTQKRLPCLADPAGGAMQISENGVAYYDSLDNAIVCLDTNLLETRRIPLPDHIGGNILLSPDWSTVYYCSKDAIYALDLQTNIPRMVRRHSVTAQELTGLHFDGHLLVCRVTYDDGHTECLYLSAGNGEAYYPDRELDRLYTGTDTYFASFRDGSVQLWLTGKPETDPWMLHVSQSAEVIPLYQSDALVIAETTDAHTSLSYLDLTTGRRTSALTLELPAGISALSGNDGVVWFLANNTSGQLLYRWSPAWSRVWSPSSYYRTYYTAEDPDINGLLRQAYQASVLGNTYGIQILTGKDALTYQPAGYTAEMEHQIAAYERDLAVLKAALANFPAEFFQDAAYGSKNRKLTVNLVRDLRSDSTAESLTGTQYWLNESAYITLAMGPELEQSFYHQLSHIIDNRVMGTTSVYDDWASLNPAGISYANSYNFDPANADHTWFEGDSRAFVDLYSMSYPREDRARILEYAMMPGNEELFASETMQKKLSTLCQGIRQAFGLDGSATYLWEQYLISESE